MNKNWYKLIFKQLQPLHIGVGSYGIISETRIFIPGWTIWGALTKAYNLQFHYDLSKNQELFKKISCFYPCFNEEGNNPLLPNYKKGEFYLGDYSETEFRAKFVDTFVSTAIVPASRMAKDESLHEINIILPGAKSDFLEDKKEKQLYWVGMLNIEEDKKIEFLKENELEIIVGGDSRYGFGKIKLVKIGSIDKGTDEFKNLFKSNYIPVQKNLNADIELVVDARGYERNGLIVENPQYCYIPGYNYEKKNNIKLEKGYILNDSGKT